MAEIRHLLEIAAYAAREAGKAIMEVYHSGRFLTEMKPGEFPLTRADKNSHTLLTQHLVSTNLPVLSEEGIPVDFMERKRWEYFWLIDPLDGTREFINKNGQFTVNIALIQGNQPVGGLIYVPCQDSLYTGSKETGVHKNEKGTLTHFPPLADRIQFQDLLQRKNITVVASRSHVSPETTSFINQFPGARLISIGSSLKFMLLLENQADIYPRLGSTMEWDTAAAHAILNASNRGVYQTDLQSELLYNKPDLTNPFFIAF